MYLDSLLLMLYMCIVYVCFSNLNLNKLSNIWEWDFRFKYFMRIESFYFHVQYKEKVMTCFHLFIYDTLKSPLHPNVFYCILVVFIVGRLVKRFPTAWVQFPVSVVNPLYSKLVLGDKTRSCASRSRYKHYALRQLLLYVFTQGSVDI